MSEHEKVCPLCGGDTIKFKGKGLDLEYWICPNKDKPGHLTRDECEAKFREMRNAHAPRSGRFG